MVPPQNVARIVVSFPASRRRSPTAFMRAPETSGATIRLRPGSRLGGRSRCGKMNALMTPQIEPMTAQPSIARTRFALRVPRSACARLSQPRVSANSPSAWTASSKSSSKRISSKARHLEMIGAAVGISERDGDGHLATPGRIFRLELVHFDDPLVRHELTRPKPSMTHASRSQGIRRPELSRVRPRAVQTPRATDRTRRNDRASSPKSRSSCAYHSSSLAGLFQLSHASSVIPARLSRNGKASGPTG